jgi:hypothetical protein
VAFGKNWQKYESGMTECSRLMTLCGVRIGLTWRGCLRDNSEHSDLFSSIVKLLKKHYLEPDEVNNP